MLRGSFPQPQLLQLGRAGPAQSDVDAAAAVAGPPFRLRRDDGFKRHFHPAGYLGPAANGANDVGQPFVVGSRIEFERQIPQIVIQPAESGAVPLQRGRIALQVGQVEIAGQIDLPVRAHQRVHTASRTARNNAQQALRGLVGKAGGEIGHDQHVKRFRDLARVPVVVVDRVEFVAEVRLNHVLHVLGQVDQPLLNVGGFGPDPVVHQRLVEIGEVHEGGEILPPPHGVDDGELHFGRGK